ncbi:MAG: serine hydrolase domain-containing protein [Planctomycetota bacterium]|jgi:CubicO group peptidase (beta-lactamase class C family)
MGRFTGIVAFLLLAGAAALARSEDETVVRGAAGEKLDRIVQRTTGGGFWGVVLVASKGEVILAKGYGFADYFSRPNTPRTLFEIASTSKPVTAVGILKLRMEGKLRLEDSLAKFFKGVPDDKQGITIRQLLTHTSGISPRVGIPYASRLTREQAVKHFLKAPLVTEPGEKFAYCNCAYAILAAIIEKASGRSFESYMKKEVFGPAGLVDTGFVQDRSLDSERMTTRLSERMPGATAGDWHWSWGYRGMGGVVTTAYDLLRLDRALRGDKLLDEQAKRDLYTPALDGYACGWRVGTTARGTKKFQHSGGVEGYAANYVRYLEEDAVVVLLSNGKSDIHSVTKAIEEQLFPPPRIRLTIDVGPYELSEYKAAEFSGTAAWNVKKWGGEILVVLEDSKKKRAVATIHLPEGAASKLHSDLAAQLAGRRGREKKTVMDAGAYLRPYNLEEGKVEISDGLELQVMPRYTGRGRKGERIVDERITFIVLDKKRGQWPIMAKMDRRTAKALLKDLQETLGR